MKRILVSLLCLVSLPLMAECEFNVGAEAIYGRPVECFFAYAIIDTQPVQTFTLVPQFDWGFRVWSGARLNCSGVDVTYTRFNETATESIRRDANVIAIGGITFTEFARAIGRVKYEHQKVDARVSHWLVDSPCREFFVYLNARWLQWNVIQAVDGTTIDAVPLRLLVNTGSDFNGGGLGIGVGGRIPVCGGFSVGSCCGVVGLVGGRQPKFQLSLLDPPPPQVASQNAIPRRTTIVPGFDFDARLEYARSIWCGKLTAHVGWHVDYYFDITAIPQALPTASIVDVQLNVRCQGLGLGGLIFGAAWAF